MVFNSPVYSLSLQPVKYNRARRPFQLAQAGGSPASSFAVLTTSRLVNSAKRKCIKVLFTESVTLPGPVPQSAEAIFPSTAYSVSLAWLELDGDPVATLLS